VAAESGSVWGARADLHLDALHDDNTPTCGDAMGGDLGTTYPSQISEQTRQCQTLKPTANILGGAP